MFQHYRTIGIVFKKEDRGEADQLLTVYTKDFGKIEVLAKAVRKINSKLRSGAELFMLSEIEFIQGKTHKTLTDAIPLEKFYNIRKSLIRLQIAFAVSDLITQLAVPQEADLAQDALIKETFHQLNNLAVKTDRFFLLGLYFFWNFITRFGYAPEIYNCVSCEKKLVPGDLYFSPALGGAVCGLCFPKIKKSAGGKITPETIKILRILIEKKWPVASRIKIEPEQRWILETITRDYKRYIMATNS